MQQEEVLQPLVSRSGSTWYGRGSALAEIRAVPSCLASRSQILHFLYGEHTYRYSGHLRAALPSLSGVVATYHTPAWRMRELVEDVQSLKRLDAVIAMSSQQATYLAGLVDSGRVHFVHHGVDSSYFVPSGSTSPATRPTFITVGHHLRDFALLSKVAGRVNTEYPDARFLVVARADTLHQLAGLPNVVTVSGVSDDDLRGLYQSAHALLLPLEDTTANNALLEGMACGLPVLSTDLEGVRDYTTEESRILHAPGDAEAMLETVLAICRDQVNLDSLRVASREAAVCLNWDVIAARTRSVYAGISG